jgi:hypothetical protein
MRSLPLLLLPIGLAAGCAGNIADHIGSRADIVDSELARYGLDPAATSCVAEQLGNTLSPLQMRRLKRAASSVKEGWFEPGRLTLRDFSHVASEAEDPAVSTALAAATQSCGLTAPAAPAVASSASSGAAAAAPAAWLNLGAAATGQAIAIDASTIEQDASGRKAWFRLTNPGASGPTGTTYLLRVDCTGRTISPIAQRRLGAGGAAGEYRAYGDEEDGPLAVERGTVMEIAWLALCT